MDKFVLAENPMREDHDVFICHLLNPVAIFQTHEGHVIFENAEKIYRHYQFKNIDGIIEEWTLSVHHFFTTDFLTEPNVQAEKLIDKAWRWYRAYMEWEDKNIDDARNI